MDQDTLIALKKLGVDKPICQNCKSEWFQTFTVFGDKVINCGDCNEKLQNERGDPKSTSEDEGVGALVSELRKPSVLEI